MNKKNNITIKKGYHCKDCGWAIICACCNDEFCNFRDASEWDWWCYCSNKGCKNHEGNGIFQEDSDWFEADEEN